MKTNPSSLRYRAMLGEVNDQARKMFYEKKEDKLTNPYQTTDKRHKYFERAAGRFMLGEWLVDG